MGKIIFIIIITIILSAGLFLLFKGKFISQKSSPTSKVYSEDLVEVTPTPTPIPTPYKIDYKMNLNGELESVNPQVLDEDFSDLESLVKSI
ncbi:hypothetical protein A3B45_03700 [Candidatus Daviesbacteria bacterium RIFCSPLOWO2_01_FULL_39_12]|uniref:Uncharacterized protein n=1 Tax=Candidatus Daviesbacteria bacterium RIFCSPLOWO2_01_FULL_39_12 TaxID=1797785 RepID=A0A1F5KTV7_9BACT|nr:MAG: hypothetical protein A3B45_03700 [Candidatus Daviesbacteria bacterium RIFCSPLOWO2_01_FULL_39_12]